MFGPPRNNHSRVLSTFVDSQALQLCWTRARESAWSGSQDYHQTYQAALTWNIAIQRGHANILYPIAEEGADA